MNYQKLYNQIIERAQERVLSPDMYKEVHHIIPKCLGGSNEKENLVKLTAREHFICHWMLSRIYPEDVKIGYAFWAMCNQKTVKQERYIPSSRTYSEGKQRFILLKKQEESPLKGRQRPQEVVDLIKKNTAGKKKPEGFGKTVSKRQIGRVVPQERRDATSRALLGRKKPEGFGDKIAESNRRLKSKGTYITPEGNFNTASEAGIHNKCSATAIYTRCKSSNFKEYTLLLK